MCELRGTHAISFSFLPSLRLSCSVIPTTFFYSFFFLSYILMIITTTYTLAYNNLNFIFQWFIFQGYSTNDEFGLSSNPTGERVRTCFFFLLILFFLNIFIFLFIWWGLGGSELLSLHFGHHSVFQLMLTGVRISSDDVAPSQDVAFVSVVPQAYGASVHWWSNTANCFV